jgi:histidyl-tRNA synthetase
VSKLLQTSSGDHTSPENGASAEQTARTIQALIGSQQSPVTGSRTREEILARLLQKRQRAASNTEYQLLISFLERWMAISSGLEDAESAISAHVGPRTAEFAPLATRFLAPVRLLTSYGIEADRILVRPALSRSWEYYSDLVFEVRAGNGDLLAAGGRYDTFAALLGASTQVPAVGVAFFVDTMARHAGVAPEAVPRPLTVTAASLVDALPAAMILRQHGQDVRVLGDKFVSTGPELIRIEAGQLIHDNTNYSLEEIDRLLLILAKGRLG